MVLLGSSSSFTGSSWLLNNKIAQQVTQSCERALYTDVRHLSCSVSVQLWHLALWRSSGSAHRGFQPSPASWHKRKGTPWHRSHRFDARPSFVQLFLACAANPRNLASPCRRDGSNPTSLSLAYLRLPAYFHCGDSDFLTGPRDRLNAICCQAVSVGKSWRRIYVDLELLLPGEAWCQCRVRSTQLCRRHAQVHLCL